MLLPVRYYEVDTYRKFMQHKSLHEFKFRTSNFHYKTFTATEFHLFCGAIRIHGPQPAPVDTLLVCVRQLAMFRTEGWKLLISGSPGLPIRVRLARRGSAGLIDDSFLFQLVRRSDIHPFLGTGLQETQFVPLFFERILTSTVKSHFDPEHV